MTTRGTVREWSHEEGWGVIDSPETPGGCWTHFSHLLIAAYRGLHPGQQVELDWEAPGQDGYPYRAVRVWPAGQEPVEPKIVGQGEGGFSSTLTISWDDDPAPA
ncbi:MULTISPECIES: cold-shock protein [unclassified Pseudofrankia]|uniref:cold-shock protein n=1 Tax=unclassified Pseudofrankia TaxID=2994372 RepID=UPI0008D91E43|nr:MULTISPECIES: cold shock domain-containing protein [unclassified Pseudofrankia]MDT3438958.1 cold shock domain-containing protein [Pseudofrankia sp. BMG5.37]OHV50568.1 cold-shock protein [Pseudofrankia sp. BMG5.36]